MVVWNKTIIDVEHDYPFELTVDSVDSLAGKKNPFHKFVQGIGILPSKAMKKNNNDFSDWGESKMRQDLHYLFKKSKYNEKKK